MKTKTTPQTPPDYIDIHAHVNFAEYDADRDAVVARAIAEKVWMINVGVQKDTSQDAVTLAEKYPEGVYASVGIHPVDTTESLQFDMDFYRTLARHPKVVAIGECGLDYYRLDAETKSRQKDVFEKHVALAQEIGKPLMLHIRNDKSAVGTPENKDNAYADAIEILKKYSDSDSNSGADVGAKLTGDVHFFAGTAEDAEAFISLGFSLSFTGVITFTHDYDEIVRKIPLEKIMSETDCPYITPVPFRGKRNEPIHVREVVKRIAEIKGLDFETVRKQLVENAMRMFKIQS